MAYLTVRIKEVAGHSTERLPADATRLTIGRTSQAEITIRHESVSREHCALIFSDGAWFLEDCGSANGTRLNNDRIAGRTALQERDIIKIGKARITFHVGDPGERRSPRSSDHNDAAIALEEDGDNTPLRNMAPHDPPQAIPCAHCGTWFSIAHRLPGERIPCPRCDRQNTIPVLVQPASEDQSLAASRSDA
ncbi:MAG: FHA domain-containing protein [Planctomycetota bacterium]|nr:MAG: FHA domain-containing protein [Planctomycetota bacterium]